MINFRKNHQFAGKSALLVAFFATAVVFFISLIFFNISSNTFNIFLFSSLTFCVIFIISFLVFQLRVEKFIIEKIKKIYKDVSLLESAAFTDETITTNMETLTKEVKKFAIGKKLEIEMLKVQEQYRREFLGNVTHELKTPLFTLQGYISTLADGAKKDKKILDKYLKRSEKAIERLIYIVEDLDIISKFENGVIKLEIIDFDIIELIQNVIDIVETKAEEKHISVYFENEFSNPIIVSADKDKIQQVLDNLIINSIKYGKKNGKTEISIVNLTNKKILIRIKDNGEGIESHNIPRLFERFFRISKSRSRDMGGSGLGLSIVKHILEAHREKIFVDSEYTQGSEFSFTLEKKHITDLLGLQ